MIRLNQNDIIGKKRQINVYKENVFLSYNLLGKKFVS
jgi:hypothetical protein